MGSSPTPPFALTTFKQIYQEIEDSVKTRERLESLSERQAFLVSRGREIQIGSSVYGHLYRIRMQGKKPVKQVDPNYTYKAFYNVTPFSSTLRERTRAVQCARLEYLLNILEKAALERDEKQLRMILCQLEFMASLDPDDRPTYDHAPLDIVSNYIFKEYGEKIATGMCKNYYKFGRVNLMQGSPQFTPFRQVLQDLKVMYQNTWKL
ncbi:MAG TPA: hypothetical protein VGJ00_07390 [Rhabdochlamydiaceae bacterium]|jgi:hypothetical protein